MILVLGSTTNGVNLTDGLDGLAADLHDQGFEMLAISVDEDPAPVRDAPPVESARRKPQKILQTVFDDVAANRG